MSFATASQRPDVSDAVLARGPANFPTEIVRQVFEASVTPGRRAEDDQQRQRTAYSCCLVSKEVKAWVEPMLYKKVVLQSSEQTSAFLDALELKSAEFLTRTVKTVWIFAEPVIDFEIDRFHFLFSKCLSLESLACRSSWICISVLQCIPKPKDGPYKLRELTLIEADSDTALQLSLQYLSIRKLQLINSNGSFFKTLCDRILDEGELLDALRAISRIYFDSIQAPHYFTTWRKSAFLSLILMETPEADSRIYIRFSRMNCHKKKRVRILEKWMRNFDEDVQQYGHRLLIESDVETMHNATDLMQPIDWIGLE